MTSTCDARLGRAREFQALHRGHEPLVLASPWDAGTARILDLIGFKALSTTSAGLAFSLGRRAQPGEVTLQEVIANATAITEATNLPVTADLGNGFGHSPDCVAKTIQLAGECAGLVGGSIGDATGNPRYPVYDLTLAIDRIVAAAEAARRLPFPFVLVARVESFGHGGRRLDRVISRLRAFETAGADVLYAPGLIAADEISEVCRSVSKPVNVAAGVPGTSYSVEDLAALGARRISVGSALCRAAITALVDSAREFRVYGTCTFAESAIPAGILNTLMRSRVPEY
jgi:2-methylisocitrate lyase-like PEP mutase family enzyme